MQGLEIGGGNGIILKYRGKKVALDPLSDPKADIIFISHAHFDHLSKASNSIILTSKETQYIAKERNFYLENTRDELEGFELINSGHILGSKALRIYREILYTGDFCLRDRAFLRKGIVKNCDVLIIESTYGRKEFVFPSTAKIIDDVNRLIADLFSKGVPVILMGYPLGKAQALSYLFSNWEPIYLYESVRKMNRLYINLGIELKEFKSYSEAKEKNLLNRKPWILIAPLRSLKKGVLAQIKKKYKAVSIGFTGWALNKSYKYMMGLDHAFPLSDHCDFNELNTLVKLANPRKIYTVHGYASDFASHLRSLGHDAEALVGVQTCMTDYF
ncbi:MAG: MBL fold metallo-hydrolase RNA specificity domain-containing protein [Nitrososphaerales archaeon]